MKLALAVSAIVGSVGGCADDGGPRLADAVPARATAGAQVELAGERFCGASADCARAAAKIEIGLEPPVVQALVLAYAERAATIQIPQVAAVGATHLVLTVDGRSSNALDFEVLP